MKPYYILRLKQPCFKQRSHFDGYTIFPSTYYFESDRLKLSVEKFQFLASLKKGFGRVTFIFLSNMRFFD